MRIYLSGPQASWGEQLQDRDLLVSFAEPRQLKLLDGRISASSWLVDSGAFTAWTRGRQIDLAAYIAFCQGLEAQKKAGLLPLGGYLALDVIPGEKGRLPTPDEVAWATAKSAENLAAMMDAGLSPWPVYHEGEPMDLLDAYVDQGHDVIALGATASRGKSRLVDWLAPIFERHPGQRFHGLAMTQGKLLRSLPFHSVDSTSWINLCRYGVEANLYLLRGRSPGFWQALGYDLPPFDVARAGDELAARGADVLRLAGVLALHDTWTSPAGSPVTREGQMLIAPASSLGGVPRGPKVTRPHGHKKPAMPSRIVPGQLPMFRARRRTA